LLIILLLVAVVEFKWTGGFAPMQPELYVEVEFFSSEEGGRTTPIFLTDYPGYRPHFRVIRDTEYVGVQFLDTPHRIISPHERVPIAVSLLYYPNVTYDKLIDGAEFEILEGPKVVGKGTVIGVLVTGNSL
jgi:translation elongation factor EF-Tu-like GTPase